MEVRTVAVIGAGTMGAGIAQVCAQSGWHTRIFDAFPNSLENGIERIKSFWEKGIEKGKTTEKEKDEWSQNLVPCYEISEALEGADLVIEALGFEPEEIPKLFGEPDLEVTKWGTIKADLKTLKTNIRGVFAAGDIVRGASLVVWAIKDGRDAAVQIRKFLIEKDKLKNKKTVAA